MKTTYGRSAEDLPRSALVLFLVVDLAMLQGLVADASNRRPFSQRVTAKDKVGSYDTRRASRGSPPSLPASNNCQRDTMVVSY